MSRVKIERRRRKTDGTEGKGATNDLVASEPRRGFEQKNGSELAAGAILVVAEAGLRQGKTKAYRNAEPLNVQNHAMIHRSKNMSVDIQYIQAVISKSSTEWRGTEREGDDA